MERCTNLDCRRVFHASEWQLAMPGTKEREDVVCPWCGTVARTEVVNGLMRTTKATPSEEAEFNHSNPLA